MKVTISYEGDLYEDREEIQTLSQAHAYKIALDEFNQELRRLYKHEEDEKRYSILEEVHELFWSVLKNNDVTLD